MRILWVLMLCLLIPGLALSQETENFEWDRPTTNTDGTPLLDLEGYHLYMAFSSIPDDKGNAQLAMEVSAETTTTSVSFVLPSEGAIVYFRILAFDTSGNESELSNQISRDFLAPNGEDLLLRFLQGVQRVLEEILPKKK